MTEEPNHAGAKVRTISAAKRVKALSIGGAKPILEGPSLREKPGLPWYHLLGAYFLYSLSTNNADHAYNSNHADNAYHTN